MTAQSYNKGFNPLCPNCGDVMSFIAIKRPGLASDYAYDNWMCDSDGYCLCFSKNPPSGKGNIAYRKEHIDYGWSEISRKEIEWVSSDGDVPADTKPKREKKETPKVECFVCNKSVASIKTHISKEHPWLK